MSNLVNFITEEEVIVLDKGDKIIFNPDRVNDDDLNKFTRYDPITKWYRLFGLTPNRKYTFDSYKRDGATGNILLKVKESNRSGIYFKYFGKNRPTTNC